MGTLYATTSRFNILSLSNICRLAVAFHLEASSGRLVCYAFCSAITCVLQLSNWKLTLADINVSSRKHPTYLRMPIAVAEGEQASQQPQSYSNLIRKGTRGDLILKEYFYCGLKVEAL